jgi:hypothetical protein
MSKILHIGERDTNTSEWFWIFNSRFLELLQSKKINTEVVEPYGEDYYRKRNLFGYEISFNANNLVIANEDTEKCVIFTTFYDLLQLKGGFKNLPDDNIQAIYSGHYDNAIVERDWPEIKDKIKPWYFKPWWSNSRYEENCYNPTNDNIYFRGLLIPVVRELLTCIDNINAPGVDIKSGKSKNYFEEVKSSKMAFSMSGIRDMCNRDVELWLMGIPFVRPRFTSQLIITIPEDTYIPVDWKSDYNYLTPIPADVDVLANDVIEKYNEVKGNKKLLTQVSKNGYNFYKENFTMDHIILKSFELLEKEGIL